MIRLPFDSNSETADYFEDLATSHEFRVRVMILDGDEEELTSLTKTANSVISGAVQYDARADISRRLSLTFLDQEGKIQFRAGTPAPQAVFVNHFVSVVREDFSPLVGKWVACPVFYGPITSFHRQGAEVGIEAMGKELLLQPPYAAKQTYTRGAGVRISEVIQTIARAQGERKFLLPVTTNAKLHRRFTIPKWGAVWPKLTKLAAAHNMFLFYNGRGQLCLRRRKTPDDAPFVFDGEFVVSTPSVDFDFTAFRNTVRVIGANPDGPKRAPVAVRYEPPSSQLAPVRIAWNDEPQYLVETIENSDIHRKRGAERLAETELRRLARVENVVSFEALPVPPLEEFDPARLDVEIDHIEYVADFLMEQWTLPLDAGGSMQVGDLRLKKFTRMPQQLRGGGGRNR